MSKARALTSAMTSRVLPSPAEASKNWSDPARVLPGANSPRTAITKIARPNTNLASC